MTDERGSRNAIGLAGAWAVVLAPTLWGVTQTVVKSLALFR